MTTRERILADYRALHAETGDPAVASRLLLAECVADLRSTVGAYGAVFEEWQRYSLDYLLAIASRKPAPVQPKPRGRPRGSRNKPKAEAT